MMKSPPRTRDEWVAGLQDLSDYLKNQRRPEDIGPGSVVRFPDLMRLPGDLIDRLVNTPELSMSTPTAAAFVLVLGIHFDHGGSREKGQ